MSIISLLVFYDYLFIVYAIVCFDVGLLGMVVDSFIELMLELNK